MLQEITINNFKCLDNLAVGLKKFTILAGLNSSGKSTIIQSLRILERYNRSLFPVFLPRSGDLRHISRIPSKPVRFKSKRLCSLSRNVIETQYVTQASEFMASEVSSSANSNSLEIIPDQTFDSFPSLPRDTDFPACVYIGADRLGPRWFLPTQDSSEEVTNFGENCEFLYEFITRYDDLSVHPSVRHPAARGDTLSYNIGGWLQEISPGTNLEIQPDRRHGIITADYDEHTPVHVGFGLSYSLPIIVAALGGHLPYPKSRPPILLVENPEAHLHPRGQTKIAELLALAVNNNVQIVVETHSDHFIDGVRLAVKEGKIASHDVAIHYCFLNENLVTSLDSPIIFENGKLNFWPEGFCDQSMVNRIRIARN